MASNLIFAISVRFKLNSNLKYIFKSAPDLPFRTKNTSLKKISFLQANSKFNLTDKWDLQISLNLTVM